MYSLPERNSRRNFNFTPTKPPKQQRIREYIVYCKSNNYMLWSMEFLSFYLCFKLRLSYWKISN